MKQLSLILLAVVLPFHVHAGKIIGNGGDVVVCENGAPPQLLDFYEARDIRDIKISEPKGDTYRDKFMALQKRIYSRFPDLSRELVAEFRNFERHTKRLSNVELENIDDSFHAVLPKGCSIKQIAIQREPMFPRDPMFIVNNDLWDPMSLLDKAGLALHESLYRFGLRNGLEHSVGIRYLVGLLFSEDIATISDFHWIEGFRHSRIKYYEVDGIKIPLFQGKGSCEAAPGTTSCQSSAAIQMARITYSTDEQVETVTYEGEGELIRFSAFGVEVGIQAREVHFHKLGSEEAKISMRGKLVLNAKVGMGPLTGSSIDFDGDIYPHKGELCGQRTVLDNRGSYSGVSSEDNCISIWDALQLGPQ